MADFDIQVADNIDNFLDTIVPVLGLNELFSDDFNNFAEASEVFAGIPVSASDDINNFSDTVVAQINSLALTFSETISFLDALQLLLHYRIIQHDHFVVSDEILARSTTALGASEQLSFSDALQLQLNIALEVADSNVPDDAIATLVPTLLTVSAADTLAFTDAVGTSGVRLTPYTTYLRRYLNDVIN